MVRRLAVYMTILLGYFVVLCIVATAKHWAVLEQYFAASVTGVIGFILIILLIPLLFIWLLRLFI